MICILLAGGRGTRLLPITEKMPKPLILFNNRTILDLVVEKVYERVDKIIIVVEYLAEQIISHVSRSAYADMVEIVFQNPKCRGTFGALVSASKHITNDFLVICSDNLYDEKDIDKLLRKPNSILVKKVNKLMKEKVYKDAKISLIPSLTGYNLEAGAWFLDKEFVKMRPVLVEGTNEYGIPHTIYLDFMNSPTKYEIVFAEFWYPLGTHWELDYAERNL